MKHERWVRLQRESEALQTWARQPIKIEEKSISEDTDAWIAAVSRENAQRSTRQEVALSDDLAASFHREAMSLSLISEHCVMLLDRAETYLLLSLLEAEFKGMVS